MHDQLTRNSPSSPPPDAPKTRQSLVWVVLAAVVVVCFAIFRAGDRDDGGTKPDKGTRRSLAPGQTLSKKDEIRTALERRISVNFQDRLLEECLHEVQRQMGIQMHIDRVAMKAEAVPLDMPVTMNLQNMSARLVLQLLLEPVILTYEIRDDVLLITTTTRYKPELETRAFDVADLVVIHRVGDSAEADFAPLIDLIKSAFPWEFREDAAQPFSIDPFSANGVNSLVIRQDVSTLEQIGALLAELRAERHPEMAAVKARPRPTKPQAPPTNKKDGALPGSTARFDAVVRGNNEFALELYAQLAAERKGNLFFAPYSLTSALAMVHAGAKAETASEMQTTLHFPPWQERVPEIFHGLTSVITEPAPSTAKARAASVGIAIANRLWFRQGTEFEDSYRKILVKHFGAEPATFDFTDGNRAADEINRRIEEDTQGLVKGVVRPEQINEWTGFVVTNAMGFAGVWARPFRMSATTQELFETPEGFTEVPLMSQLDYCGYAEIEGAEDYFRGIEILDKPYGNGELSLIILLPRSKERLVEIERQLSERRLAEWMATVEQRQVEVLLPRFRLESAFNMAEALQHLGIRTAFSTASADFSGICSKGRLALGPVMHKAVIEVNELGTRATAASQLSGSFGGRDPTFKATIPFIFLIRDNRTGCILFLGRLVNPSE